MPNTATYEIILTGGAHRALVDEADYENLCALKWAPRKGRNGAIYAQTRVKIGLDNGETRFLIRGMHRIIMDPDCTLPSSTFVDHRNWNTLDNRRDNLRIVNIQLSNLNRQIYRNNTTGYRGVYLNSEHGKYQAQLMSLGVRHSGGSFAEAADAARAYNRLALLHHGEHAQLNIVEE